MPITFEDIPITGQKRKLPDIDISKPIIESNAKLNFNDIPLSSETSKIRKQKFQTNLSAWLDRALRGQYVAANVVKTIQDMPTSDQIKLFTMPYALENEKLNKITQAVKKGVTGEEKGAFKEVIEKTGLKGKPAAIAGFVGDVIYDPTNLMGGLLAKGTKKIISPIIRPITKKITPALPKLMSIKKWFKQTTGIPQLDELVEKYTLQRHYLKGKSFQYGSKVRNVIQNISKKTGRKIDDISQEIVNLIELPEKTVATLPETQTLANTLKSHFSTALTKEMKAGVPITALSQTKKGIQYFPRITTQEAQQYLKQAKIGNAKVWNPKLANALQRHTADFTLQEFNDFVAQNGLKSLGGKSVEEFFMKNPAYATAIRGIKSAKAITSAQFLKETGKLFGKTAKEAPAFWEELPESIQKIYPNLRGIKFDPEVLTELNRVSQKLVNPQEINNFLKGYDKIQNLWKAWTLAPFPSYHFRNVIGNLWNNYLAGVTNPAKYNQAARLQYLRKVNKLKPNEKQIVDLAERYGVLGSGWYGSDIPMAIEETIGRGSLNPFKQNNLLIKKGRAVGTTLENNARLAHFIDKLSKGLSPDEAAKSVKKFLFDYADLSDFERNILKRVFPFYTWTRKNLPLQMEQLIKQPQKFTAIEKARRAISGTQVDKDVALLKRGESWLYEKLPFRIGKPTKGVVRFFPLETWLPAADLVKLARPTEIGQELLTPLIKMPLEQILNKNLYFEQPIQKWGKPFSMGGETREFLRLDIPVRIAHILSSVRLLNEVDKIISKRKLKQEELTPSQKALRVLTGIKTYPYNISELKSRVRFKIDQQVRELEKARRWALRNGRYKEVERINKTIRNVKQEKFQY